MSDYDLLLTAIDKTELTQEQKDAILKPAKAMSTESGIRGSDLLKVKGELETANGEVANFKQFSDEMAKYNMKSEDIKRAADFAGIRQTQDDKIQEYVKIISEKDKKIKESETFIRVSKMEKLLSPKFDEAIKNYKDSEGKGFNFLKDFTDVVGKELFDGIKEGDDEVIITDRISKALEKARSEQEGFMKRNGLVSLNKDIHRVSEQNLNAPGSVSIAGINAEELHKKFIEGGQTTDAAAIAIAAIRNAHKQE